MRAGVAVFFVVLHLAAFWRAGHVRLGLPFDSAPGEAPAFYDIHAPATRGYPRQPQHWSRLVLSRWDAQHYIGTATRGLTACPDNPNVPDGAFLDCGLGWLPGYGKAGGVLAGITGIAPDFALVLISLIAAFLINFMLTAPFVMDRFGRFESYAALLALNLFPTAFYLVTPYAEAATLALGIGAWWAIAKERWVIAGALIGAATALKAQAAVFALGGGLAMAYVAYLGWRAKTPRWWRPLLGAPLCIWGQLATVMMLKIATGDFTAFFRARKAFGDVQHWHRIVEPMNYVRGFHAQHLDMVMFTGVLVVMLLTLREVIAKLPRPEAIYIVTISFATLPLAIVAPLHWWGMNRYLLMCVLAFLGAGQLARRQLAFFTLWLLLCVGFYWHVELCSYVAQGDPQVCPCTGEMEFTMPFGS
ncbi:MAG: hypothetical protein JO257_11545 [Deltaproteobacteria bacterium]|nr:hypothetical protein [Deltaproteobacteria bacterium]